jgi:hypothetical protein
MSPATAYAHAAREQIGQEPGVEEEAVADHCDERKSRRTRRPRPHGPACARCDQRWIHWCSVFVLPGSAAKSSMNFATRRSCQARWKLTHISRQRLVPQVAADER